MINDQRTPRCHQLQISVWNEESPEDLLVSLFAAVSSPANLCDNDDDYNDDDDDDNDYDEDDEGDNDDEVGGEDDDDGNLAVALAQGTGAMTWALPVLHNNNHHYHHYCFGLEDGDDEYGIWNIAMI